jgi:RNA polymerase sigma-70 factor (ECF subfamily)
MASASVSEMKRPVLPAGAAADPDVALMLRVQGGDEGAFQELFRKFAPRVPAVRAPFRGKRGAGRGAHAGRVRPGLPLPHRYKPQSRLSTWMFTIATNLCLNELRRPEQKRRVDIWDTRATPTSIARDRSSPTRTP